MVLVIGAVASGKCTFVRSLGVCDADLFDCALAQACSQAEGARDGAPSGRDAAPSDRGDASFSWGAAPSDPADAPSNLADVPCDPADVRARLNASAAIVHLEEALRPGGLFATGTPAEVASALADKRVVACCEVGSGVVPVDADVRAWRERVGRVCCELAAQADVVVRMVCGIPQVLKGSLDRAETSDPARGGDVR